MVPLYLGFAGVVIAVIVLQGYLSLRRRRGVQQPRGSDLPFEVARVSDLTHRQAEELLDWLEQNGYQHRELRCEAEKLFAVEFRVDAEHALPSPMAWPHAVQLKQQETARK